MNKKLLMLTFLIKIIFYNLCDAQRITDNDSIQYTKARNVSKHISSNTSKVYESEIVFSMLDETTFLVIRKKNKQYLEYYAEYDIKNKIFKILESNIIDLKADSILMGIKTDSILNLLFQKDSYWDNLITLNSDFYKNIDTQNISYISGNLSYFVFFENNGFKVASFRLPFVISPSPLNMKVHAYLQAKMTIYFYKYH